MWCDVYVKCGAMWNVAISDMWNAIEMQNVRCGIWRVVDCGVPVCGRLQNARRVSVMRNVVVWNCDEGGGIFNVVCDCCVISDVENDASCCDVRCGGVMQNYQDVVV